MQSINLSKLVLSPIFLELIKESGSDFDHIFTDNEKLAKEKNVKVIKQNFETTFSRKEKGNALFLLDQIGTEGLLPRIHEKFDTCTIINARTGMGSFGKKIKPETNYLDGKFYQKYPSYFPFDLEGLLKTLKGKNKLILLTNQEVPENKYESSNDEEFPFIDKSLIEEPELLYLLSPEKPELLLIGTGNHFEELVKLSQTLQQKPETIALIIIGNQELLSSEEIKGLSKTSKQIGIIIDHIPSQELQKNLESELGKKVHLLTPNYQNLTSISPEYQFEQTAFDAKSLYTQSLHLLKQT